MKVLLSLIPEEHEPILNLLLTYCFGRHKNYYLSPFKIPMAKKEEKFNKRRLTTSVLTTVLSIALVLFMLGLLGLIVLNAKKLSDYVKENITLSVIMEEDVSEADIIILRKSIDTEPYRKSTKYITKEEAAQELKKDLGEDFVEFLGYNPLLPSIEVNVNAEYANNDSLKVIQQEISNHAGVKEVYYEESLVEQVNKNMQKISIILLGFSIILILIAIALINNTIRLSVFSKRFLIKSMQLVGATQRFIRRPFLIKGILHGIISSLLAIAMLIGTIYLIYQSFPELINLSEVDLYLILFAGVILIGLFFSWISTYFAVRKYLKIKTNNLYYY
ncbi:MAG: ABC transporter permease [Bacteroidales bacterium]|nr:ABC transporter permease [Bacteroidales bacterium]MCF8328132.1 ABC transporter permease [Bacteroidales bacterium]